MGKGIIIPVKKFVQMYLSEINKIFEDGNDEHEALDKIVKEFVNEKYEVSSLGHDALESRHGDMQALDKTPNMKAFNQIQEWRKESYPKDLPIQSLSCGGDLMFIGVYMPLGDAELSYYVKAPEIIYSLPAFIPHIIDCYETLKQYDYSDLEKTFGQEACIWTFTSDCACCG